MLLLESRELTQIIIGFWTFFIGNLVVIEMCKERTQIFVGFSNVKGVKRYTGWSELM